MYYSNECVIKLTVGLMFGFLLPQVVEKVRVFVSDANDERPEFLGLPYIVNVPEVRNALYVASCFTDTLIH